LGDNVKVVFQVELIKTLEISIFYLPIMWNSYWRPRHRGSSSKKTLRIWQIKNDQKCMDN